jgi:putative Mg2+ transporter-C (MgtC) family protein
VPAAPRAGADAPAGPVRGGAVAHDPERRSATILSTDAWLAQSWATVEQEFSDLGDPSSITRVVLRLLVALALGALLGYERESVGASAGLRHHELRTLGAAGYVQVPLQAGMPLEDASRVLQGVIAGIGFLGAGAILKLQDENQIKGLTTAAGVWLTSAVGIAAGMGLEATAVLSAVLAWMVLSLLRTRKPGSGRER